MSTTEESRLQQVLNQTLFSTTKQLIDAAEIAHLKDAQTRSLLAFAFGGNPLSLGIPPEQPLNLPGGLPVEHIRALVAEKVSNTGISREMCVDVLTLQTHEMELRAIAAMDEFIARFYDKHLHPDLFYPQNLRLVARYMLSNGFDAHTRTEDTTDHASQPLTAPRSTYEGMKAAGLLGKLGTHVRLSKLTIAASQDSLGRGLVVSHFANSLLQDVLISGLKVYLTECPHLRTVFGKSRLPRAALVMPALRVSLASVSHQAWDTSLMFWCH